MPDTALYFPYIEPPDDPWFRQMLLYWDCIGTILPLDYRPEPESQLTRLIGDGIIVPVRPGHYYGGIRAVGDAFLEHIFARAQAERRKPVWSRVLGEGVEVHAEKLDFLAEPLVEAKLARRLNYEWFEMPEWAANEFMTFLACALGRLNRSEFQPITNNSHCEALITGSTGIRSFSAAGRTHPLRETLLLSVLPSPPAHVSFDEILKFKAKHAKLLKLFRSEIEEQSRALARLMEPADRLDAARDAAGRLETRCTELEEEMRGRWHGVLFACIVPLLGASAEISGATPIETAGWISAVSSLATATYGAATMLKRPVPSSLAYAIKARRHSRFSSRQ